MDKRGKARGGQFSKEWCYTVDSSGITCRVQRKRRGYPTTNCLGVEKDLCGLYGQVALASTT